MSVKPHTPNSLLSTGSTHRKASRYDRKNVDWDVKHQHKIMRSFMIQYVIINNTNNFKTLYRNIAEKIRRPVLI